MTGEPERRDTLGAGEAAGTGEVAGRGRGGWDGRDGLARERRLGRERWPGAGEAAGTGETAWGEGERCLAQEWTGLAAARPAKRLSGRCGGHINLRR